MKRFRLAHLSDPHLGPLPRPPLASLVSKRIFGYLNWQKNRRRALGANVLAAILNDVAVQNVDHVCVTGDLVNIALPEEFCNAARWLETLGEAASVSVVPGNHDAYVPGAAKRAAKAWAPWCSGDAGPGFPFARRRGPILIAGVSTAVATPPLIASGRVGKPQRDALAALLDRHDDAFKVIMIHHPPDAAEASGRRGLDDVEEVREVLAAGCVDLVLHGHTHHASLNWLETARGRAAVVGVPSASSDGTKHPIAGYALVDIDPERHIVRLVRRGLPSPEGAVRTVEAVDLDLRPPRG